MENNILWKYENQAIKNTKFYVEKPQVEYENLLILVMEDYKFWRM